MKYPKTIPTMELVPDSSNIQMFGYDFKGKFLYVQFLSTKDNPDGPLYRYYKVPASVYKRFSRAPSKGMFLCAKIRDRYKHALWTGAGWRKRTAQTRKRR